MTVPIVSIVIPCRNEAATIGACLDSIAAGDYPLDRLEVLVVDGLSEDGTRRIVTEYHARHRCITLLDNPRRTQQSALNIGIKAAGGTVIIRMDAHCRFEPRYISACVRYLQDTGADNVGGRLLTRPRHNTRLGRAIAIAMSERFGVGASTFRVAAGRASHEPAWVDTVPYACYRRDVFDRVGLFNEALDRSEDAEFHRRMKEHGCRTLFVPALVNYYYARSDYWSFAAHALDNGRWAVLPTKYTGRLVVSARHLVPLMFVSALIFLACLAPFSLAARVGLVASLVTYMAVSFAVSAAIARREREGFLALLLPVVFATLHVGYGLGSLWAAAEVAPRLLLGIRTPPIVAAKDGM